MFEIEMFTRPTYTNIVECFSYNRNCALLCRYFTALSEYYIVSCVDNARFSVIISSFYSKRSLTHMSIAKQ